VSVQDGRHVCCERVTSRLVEWSANASLTTVNPEGLTMAFVWRCQRLTPPCGCPRPSIPTSRLTRQVRKDHFKGMSPHQAAAIRAEQLAQIEAARETAQVAAAEEARAAAAAMGVAAAAQQQVCGYAYRDASGSVGWGFIAVFPLLREQPTALRWWLVAHAVAQPTRAPAPSIYVHRQALDAAQARRAAAAAAAAALRRQAAEKAARDVALRETYANRVAPAYFDQFGTSHR
jgi:hypothetical protein